VYIRNRNMKREEEKEINATEHANKKCKFTDSPIEYGF